MHPRQRLWCLLLGVGVVFGVVSVAAASSFRSAVRYPTSQAPVAIVAGDFTGDRAPDVATADQADNAVSVLAGSNDGSLRAPQRFPTGPGPSDLVSADFNADNIPDVATANYDSGGPGSTSVLLGKPGGGFQFPVTFATQPGTYTLAAADVNGDGKPDLVTANTFSYNVSVLLGNGNGTFAPAQQWPTGDSTWPWAVAAADLDRDGRSDLAVAGYHTSTISILWGRGDGTFSAPAQLATGSHPVAIAAKDLNGDGRADLTTADLHGDTASVLLATSGGGFAPVRSYPVGDGPSKDVEYPSGLVVADLDNDGRLDLALDDYETSRVSVLTGNGDGTFQPPLHAGAQPTPADVEVGDLNGDGLLELLTANDGDNSVSVLLNSSNLLSDGSFERSTADWNPVNASLSLAADGKVGANALKVAYSGGGSEFHIYPWPRPVQSAVGGALYSAGGWVRSDTPGRQVCLQLKEAPPGTSNFSDTVRCLTTTTAWQPFPTTSRSATAGDTITVNVIATNPQARDSFEVDGLTLTQS